MTVPRGNTRAKDARSRTSQVNPACTSDGRLVAVRTWRADPIALQVAYKRARSLLRVHDPMIASVLACELREDALSITAEYVPGVTLDRWIEVHGLPEHAAACNLIERLALALESLHRRGVAHHALYPAKLLVCEPELDDGTMSAKLLDLAVTGAMRSWPPRLEAAHFVAPEALSNERVPLHAPASRGRRAKAQAPSSGGPNGVIDPLMNVYSLGCLLHYLCTGQPPFQSDSIERLRSIHARGAFATPRAINPRLSIELEATIRRALAFDRQARFASAGALATALSPGYGRLSTSAARRSTTPPPPPLPRAEGLTAARARSSIIPDERSTVTGASSVSRERRTQPPPPPAPVARTEARRASVAPPPPRTGMVDVRRSSPPPLPLRLPSKQARQSQASEPAGVFVPAARSTLPPPPPVASTAREQGSSDVTTIEPAPTASTPRRLSAASTVASLLEASEPASWEEALELARVRDAAANAQAPEDESESVTSVRPVGLEPNEQDSIALASDRDVDSLEPAESSKAISSELDLALDTMLDGLQGLPSELDPTPDTSEPIELLDHSYEALARALSLDSISPDSSANPEEPTSNPATDAAAAATEEDVTPMWANALEDDAASALVSAANVAAATSDADVSSPPLNEVEGEVTGIIADAAGAAYSVTSTAEVASTLADAAKPSAVAAVCEAASPVLEVHEAASPLAVAREAGSAVTGADEATKVAATHEAASAIVAPAAATRVATDSSVESSARAGVHEADSAVPIADEAAKVVVADVSEEVNAVSGTANAGHAVTTVADEAASVVSDAHEVARALVDATEATEGSDVDAAPRTVLDAHEAASAIVAAREAATVFDTDEAARVIAVADGAASVVTDVSEAASAVTRTEEAGSAVSVADEAAVATFDAHAHAHAHAHEAESSLLVASKAASAVGVADGVTSVVTGASEAAGALVEAVEASTSAEADEAAGALAVAEEAAHALANAHDTSASAELGAGATIAADQAASAISSANHGASAVAVSDEVASALCVANELANSIAGADETARSIAGADEAANSIAGADEAARSIAGADEAASMIVVADEAASTTVVAGEAGSAIIVADEAAIDVADDAASAIDVAGDAASAAGAAEHSEPVRFTWTGVSWRPSALRSERSAHASVTAGMRADTDGVESARCMTTDSSWPLLSEPAACEQALTVEVAGPVRAASERTAPERGAQVAAADPPARWTLVGVGALQDPSPDEAAEPLSGAAVDAALQARRFSRSSTLPIPPISVGTSGARARMRSRWAVRSRQLLVPLTAAGVLAVVYATVRWPADSSRDYRDEAVIATPLAAEPPSSAAGRPTQALPEPVVIPAPAVIEPPVQAPEAREPAPAIEARQRRKREDAPEANAPAPLPTWPDPEPLAIKPAAHDLQLSLGPAYDGPQAAKLAPPKAVAAAKLGAPSAAQPVSTASLPRAAKIEQLTLRGPVVATRVRRALERIRSQLTLCYEAYAPTDAGQRPSPVRVELVLNELGRVRTTDVQGASSLALGECVASASKKLQLGTPDTGRVSVSWTTTYGPVLPAAAITLKPEIDRGF